MAPEAAASGHGGPESPQPGHGPEIGLEGHLCGPVVGAGTEPEILHSSGGAVAYTQLTLPTQALGYGS
ncbi:hypothetical protein CEP53_002930, partial [Fusarium sp. AF-6]